LLRMGANQICLGNILKSRKRELQIANCKLKNANCTDLSVD
jgi:hypothetical protein